MGAKEYTEQTIAELFVQKYQGSALSPGVELNSIHEEVSSPLLQKETDRLLKLRFRQWNITLVEEIISSPPSSMVLRSKIAHLQHVCDRKTTFPLIISTFLSERFRTMCREKNVFYIDLSGNVYIAHKGLHIDKSTDKNHYPEKKPGRSPFSDKATLILRFLLEEPREYRKIREIARATNVSPGFVSKIIREMENRNYIEKDKTSRIRISEPGTLLADWANHYDLSKNNDESYFVPVRDIDHLYQQLNQVKPGKQLMYHLTLHSAAHLVSSHASFNALHLYTDSLRHKQAVINQLALEKVDHGGNVFLLHPYYKYSYSFGQQKVNGLWMVSDLQLYLDLYNYPIRGREQAEFLYEIRLKKHFERK